jgi:hypothetical protein
VETARGYIISTVEKCVSVTCALYYIWPPPAKVAQTLRAIESYIQSMGSAEKDMDKDEDGDGEGEVEKVVDPMAFVIRIIFSMSDASLPMISIRLSLP